MWLMVTPMQNSPQELLNVLCFIVPSFTRGVVRGGDAFDDEKSTASVSERMSHVASLHRKGKSRMSFAEASWNTRKPWMPIIAPLS